MYVFQTINSLQQCTAFPSICFIRVEDEFIKIRENENKLLFDISIQDFSNECGSAYSKEDKASVTNNKTLNSTETSCIYEILNSSYLPSFRLDL